MGHLTKADPVAVARAWLLSRPALTNLLGEVGGVGSHNEPPYPCVVLTDVPGSDLGARHLIAPGLQIEVLGDIDGSPGKPALRAILYTVIEELVALSDSEQQDPAMGVVTGIVSTGGGGWVPLPTGQPRYLATVQMYMHPPIPAAQP